MEGAPKQEIPNLPTAEFIKNQTRRLGDEIHVVGLLPEQAEALIEHAKINGIDISISKTPLDDFEKQNLTKNNVQVPEGSVSVYLGHTTDAHVALFKAFGLE